MGDTIEASKGKSAGIVGILILLAGLGQLICGCIMTSLGEKSASGIWTGILALLVGVLGIVCWAKKTGNKIPMVFYLVLSILCTILMIVQLVIALIGWLVWHVIRKIVETKCSDSSGTCHCSGGDEPPLALEHCDAIFTIESCFCAIVILCGIATILMLAASIIGCMATCCAKNTESTQVVVVQQPGIVMQTQGAPPPGYAEKQY